MALGLIARAGAAQRRAARPPDRHYEGAVYPTPHAAHPRRRAILAAVALLACAHAPPVRPADGHRDPEYPEVNCDVNDTVDCRPGGH
jgi:hypothetical protein